MKRFALCLAFVAGLIIPNIAMADAIISKEEFKLCISDISTTYESFHPEHNASAFELDFSHPNVEKYGCEELYHRYVEDGEGGSPVALAVVDKLIDARQAGLIRDLRETRTAEESGVTQFTPVEPKTTVVKPTACTNGSHTGYFPPKSDCPAGWREIELQ